MRFSIQIYTMNVKKIDFARLVFLDVNESRMKFNLKLDATIVLRY